MLTLLSVILLLVHTLVISLKKPPTTENLKQGLCEVVDSAFYLEVCTH